MKTFLKPHNPKDFKNHTYITRQSILLLLAIPSTVYGQNSIPKFYALISVTVHFMAVNSGGGRGVCIHASNSSSGDPLLTAGVGEQP